MNIAPLSRPLLIVALMVTPSFADPATQSSTRSALGNIDRHGRPDGDGGRGGTDGRPGGPDGGFRGENRPGGGPDGRWGRQQPTAEEWKDIDAFMQQYSPQRLDMFNAAVTQYGADDKRVQFARGAMAVRYRMLNRLKDENPDVYKKGLEQVTREDEIWGLVKLVQRDPSDTESREKLATKVRESTELLLQERKARLERIKQNLENEQEQLKKDEDQIGELVERQLKRYIEGGPLDEGGPNRRRGDRPMNTDGPAPADASPKP